MSVAGIVAEALAGLDVPVLPPGSTGSSLPAIAIVPDDNELGDGGRYVIHGYRVTVMVSRIAAIPQLARLESLTEDVVAALVLDGRLSLGTFHPYTDGAYEGVQYIAREIPVTAEGPVIC